MSTYPTVPRRPEDLPSGPAWRHCLCRQRWEVRPLEGVRRALGTGMAGQFRLLKELCVLKTPFRGQSPLCLEAGTRSSSQWGGSGLSTMVLLGDVTSVRVCIYLQCGVCVCVCVCTRARADAFSEWVPFSSVSAVRLLCSGHTPFMESFLCHVACHFQHVFCYSIPTIMTARDSYALLCM